MGHRRVFANLALVAALAVVVVGTSLTVHAQSPALGGGFTDSATSVGLRLHLTAADIQAWLPSRGAFTFPSPYLTHGIRLTNASDCSGAGDCVLPIGYSYWSNINNHAGSDTMLIVLGLARNRGGSGPTLFTYNKRTLDTRNAGPLFADDSPYSWSTGEGWYFSATRPTSLYMNDGPRMLRYDVQAHTFETVFDVRAQFGEDKVIWQMHSSSTDRVHSATLRNTGTWDMLGCVTYDEGTGRASFFAKKGDFDECQVDKSGRWLVIKENVDGRDGEDNRVIDLRTGTERVLTDPNGAAGHSDLGFGYMIAEDNYNALPGAVRRWNLAQDITGGQPATLRGQGELVYQLSSWASGIGHVTYGNARPDVPIEQQGACVSNAHREDLPRVNEIVCFRLDGSLDTLVVAPNLTDLNAPGGGSDDYSKLPKGTIDPTGEYFVWTANAGTARLDAFVVRIPWNGLGVTSAPSSLPQPGSSPAPGTSPAPPSGSSEAVRWTSLVNVTATGGTLQKTQGCHGCPDAGAVSSQRIESGDGSVSFTTRENQSLRVIGLSSGNAGTGSPEIGFALRLQGGQAEVRESGVYKSDTAFAAGDMLAVSVEGRVVKYSRNGSVFYTSTAPPTYPLLVDTSFSDLDASIVDARLSAHGTRATGAGATVRARRHRR